jgi:hypothetical protein
MRRLDFGTILTARSRILAFLQIVMAGGCFFQQLFAVIEKIRQPSCGVLNQLKSFSLLEGQLFIRQNCG